MPIAKMQFYRSRKLSEFEQVIFSLGESSEMQRETFYSTIFGFFSSGYFNKIDIIY